MKFLVLSSVIFCTAYGQSIAVTSPAANQAVSGTAVVLSVSYSNMPGVYAVEYDVDGELAGVSRSGAYAYVWNTYYASNGRHTIQAVARDVANNALATSPNTSFLVENSLPQQTTPTTDITTTTGPAPKLSDRSFSGISWWGNAMSLKTTGVAVITQAAPVKSVSNAGASLTTNTFSSTSGQALVIYAAWNHATSISVSNVGGANWSCNTVNGGGYPSQWCVGINNTANTNDAITVRYSPPESSSDQDVIYSFAVTNVATSVPIDGNVQSSGGVSPLQCTPINVVQNGEAVFFGGTWNHAHDTLAAGPGYTVVNDANLGMSGAEYGVLPSSGGWLGQWGISTTVNGPNSGVSKTFALFVDGMAVQSNTSANATNTTAFDTSGFQNGFHQVLLRVDGPNCAGCINGIWSDMGGWEQRVNFSNPRLASELRLAARESFLCVENTTTCHYPTSVTLTGSVVNTDGSSSAASLVSCTTSSTAVSGSGCTFTAATAGIAAVTVTEAGGNQRAGYIIVLPQDGLPHFSTGGAVLTTFTPGSSLLNASQFFTGYLTWPDNPQYPASEFASDYKAAGFTVFEYTLPISPPGSSVSQPSFQASVDSDVAKICGAAATYGLKVHLIGDSWARGTPELGAAMLGVGGGYTTPAWQYYMQQYLRCATAISMVDEVTSSWGWNPLEGVDTGGVLIGTNGFTQLSGDGTNSTITCSLCSFNGSSRFIITGSGQPSLDYNSATNSPIFSNNGGRFASSFSGTIASGTTQIHPYVDHTFDSGLNTCNPAGGIGGGYSLGPCNQWIHYDAFYTLRGWHLAAGGPAMTWPAVAGSVGRAISQWCGKDHAGNPSRNLADYCEVYWSRSSFGYLPQGLNLTELQNSVLGQIRNNIYPNMNLATPMIVETVGDMVDYALVGYPVPVVSCSGSTITFGQDHGLRNRLPGNTRLKISGSSGGNCDGIFYVWSIPDSTHVIVNRQYPSFTASATTGTLRWQDGSTTPVSSLNGLGASSGSGAQISPNGISISNKRGMTFAVSGSGTALDGVPFSFDYDTTDFNTQGSGVNWSPIRQMANFTASTGGTANILPNNSYVRGPQNWAPNSEAGARYIFASQVTPYLERAAGIRQYGSSLGGFVAPDFYDRTGAGGTSSIPFTAANFNGSIGALDLGGVAGGVQAQINPHWDYANTFQAWTATANANLLMQTLANSGFLFEPSLASPDYGPFFETAARASSYGNLLLIQSYADNTESCSADLSRYVIAGQPIYRYYATWSGIDVSVLSPGTVSDAMTCDPGALRAYVFPSSSTSRIETPVISATLGDVPNAVGIYVQYSYSPLVFNPAVSPHSVFRTANCGAGSCTLPVDRQIGPVYYRLLYVDASGGGLAMSAVEVL
ncbi:MAG TPA: Ig-like domain-containing protein [Bryobacteraceae bacterium]|nr:Ig-like domain-containing protein [Bryobacteraceae bacterium]